MPVAFANLKVGLVTFEARAEFFGKPIFRKNAFILRNCKRRSLKSHETTSQAEIAFFHVPEGGPALIRASALAATRHMSIAIFQIGRAHV